MEKTQRYKQNDSLLTFSKCATVTLNSVSMLPGRSTFNFLTVAGDITSNTSFKKKKEKKKKGILCT